MENQAKGFTVPQNESVVCVETSLIHINKEKERVSLGLKQMQSNPWDKIEERFPVGQKVSGKVTNLMPYGAFVQIEDAVEGLIHASEIDGEGAVTSRDKLQPGVTVTAHIVSLDRQRQRMGLSLKKPEEIERIIAEQAAKAEASEEQA